MIFRRWLFSVLCILISVQSFAQSEPAAVVNGTPVTIKMDPGTTAPANQPVSCQSGVAAAVFECGMFGCRVGLTVGVSGHGAEAQATIASIDSNAVWSLAVGGGTTCPAHNVRIGNGTMPRSGAGGGDGPAMDLIPYEVCYVYEEFWIVNGMRIDPPIYTQVLWCE